MFDRLSRVVASFLSLSREWSAICRVEPAAATLESTSKMFLTGAKWERSTDGTGAADEDDDDEDDDDEDDDDEEEEGECIGDAAADFSPPPTPAFPPPTTGTGSAKDRATRSFWAAESPAIEGTFASRVRDATMLAAVGQDSSRALRNFWGPEMA